MATVTLTMLAETRSINRGIQEVNGRLGSMGNTVSRVGSMVKAFIAAFVLDKAVDAFKDVISAASDTEQTIGGTQAVFGKYANRVISDSNKAAQAVGLSANAYRELANQTGNAFIQSGIGVGKATSMTEKLTKRAGDLFAVFGSGGDSVQTVMDAINSALRGEFDPLERFGVQLTAAQISTEANTESLKQYHKKLTELPQAQQQLIKKQAAYNLIMERTNKYNGQFAKQTGTLAEQQQILGAKVDNLKAKLGSALLPEVTKFVGYLTSKGVPVLNKVVGWLDDNKDAIERLAHSWGDRLGNALRNAFGVIKTVGDFLGSLPQPIKTLGIEVGIAAIAFGRLGPKIAQASTALSTFSATATTTSGRMALLRSGAKTAGGVGGMLLLTHAFADASSHGTHLSNVLGGALGGALTGLAVGGPIGALIGAVGGGGLTALTSMFGKTKKSADELRADMQRDMFKEARRDANSLTDALQGVVDKYGAVSIAAVKSTFVDKNGHVDKDVAMLEKLGVTQETIARGRLGDKEAIAVENRALDTHAKKLKENRDKAKAYYDTLKDGRVNYIDPMTGGVVPNGAPADPKEVQKAKKAYEDADNAAKDFTATTKGVRKENEQNAKAWRAHAAAMNQAAKSAGLTRAQFNHLPKNLRIKLETNFPQTRGEALKLIDSNKKLQGFKSIKTIIQAKGVDLTRKDIENLQKRYKLTPKQVSTLLKIEGLDSSKKALDQQANNAKAAGKKTGENYTSSTAGSLRANAGKVTAAGSDVGNRAKSAMNVDTSSVGAQMANGVAGGLYSRADAIVQAAGNIVQRGMAAMRNRADIQSPSKKTKIIGKYLAQGLTVGLKEDGQKTIDYASTLMSKLLDGQYKVVTHNKKGKKIVKSMPLLSKKDQKQVKGIVASFKNVGLAISNFSTFKRVRTFFSPSELRNNKIGLTDIAHAQTRINNALADAKSKLSAAKSAYNQYASAAKSSIVDFGNITSLNGAFTAAGMTQSLSAKLAQAKTFASYIKTLTKEGLNHTTLDQLIAAGPEAGFAYAKALVEGGKAAVGKYNTVQKQLNSVAATYGKQSAETMKRAGIQAAQGLVNGLVSKQKQLEHIATTLANSMVKAIKKKLGIHSPSRVFADVGKYTVAGLAQGLGDRQTLAKVRNASAGMTKAIETGYAQPKLATPTGGNGATIHVSINADARTDTRKMGKELIDAINIYLGEKGRKVALA